MLYPGIDTLTILIDKFIADAKPVEYHIVNLKLALILIKMNLSSELTFSNDTDADDLQDEINALTK